MDLPGLPNHVEYDRWSSQSSRHSSLPASPMLPTSVLRPWSSWSVWFCLKAPTPYTNWSLQIVGYDVWSPPAAESPNREDASRDTKMGRRQWRSRKSTSGSDVFPEGGPANALMHYKVFVPSYIKVHIILLHLVLYYYVNPPLSPHRRHAPSVDRSRPLVKKGGSFCVRGQKRSFWRS